MNKKSIIQLTIIIVAFAASGWVLYNGFFKANPNLAAIEAYMPPSSSGSSEKILPLGKTLDIESVLKKRNLRFGLVEYPKLNPAEVGIPESSLIQAPQSDTTETAP